MENRSTTSGPPQHAGQVVTAIAPSRLRWLEREIAVWQAEGIITPQAGAAIGSRYIGATKVALVRVVVALGTLFLGVGLVWLVATNLDRLSPLVRLAAVAAIWLVLVIGAEIASARSPARGLVVLDDAGYGHPEDDARPSLAAVAQLLAATAFGAVVFQAAQSTQVPAYESQLLGYWGLGALAYAYATASLGTCALAVVVLTAWCGWFIGDSADSLPNVVFMLVAAAVVAISVGVGHTPRVAAARPGFAAVWRLVGAAMALAGVFVAALPVPQEERSTWPMQLTALLAAAAVAAVLAVVVTSVVTRSAAPAWRDRLAEVVVAVAIALAGGALAWWRPDHPWDVGSANLVVTPQMWAHAGAGLLVFLAAAAWFALLGARREDPLLTAIALFGLVVFTTVQSFAVFAPIVSGATLFLGVGAVMVVTGLAADRIRRWLRRRTKRGARSQRATRADVLPNPELGSGPKPEADSGPAGATPEMAPPTPPGASPRASAAGPPTGNASSTDSSSTDGSSDSAAAAQPNPPRPTTEEGQS